MKVNYMLATAVVLAASFATVVAAETAVAPGAVQGGIMDSLGQRMPAPRRMLERQRIQHPPMRPACIPGRRVLNTAPPWTRAATGTGGCRRRASFMCYSRIATPSAALTYPVRIPPFGTGRLRSSTTTVRGISASATGTKASTSSSTARLCGVSAEPVPLAGQIFVDTRIRAWGPEMNYLVI
jgi:hypothetical protein